MLTLVSGAAMKLFLVVVGSLLAVTAASGAAADPRLDEVVYTPYVENGEAEIETHAARELGGQAAGDMTTVIEAEYGLSDRVSVALVGTLERSADRSTRLDGVGVETVTYLGQIPTLGIDVGAYLEYTEGLHGGPDVLEGKVLLAKRTGRFQGLVNLIVERSVSGTEAFASYGYAVSATWRTVGPLRVGAEAFGDLGTDHRFLGSQGAYVGPQLLWKGRPAHSPVEIGLDGGWLFPVGADRLEARSQLRISLEFERHF